MPPVDEPLQSQLQIAILPFELDECGFGFQSTELWAKLFDRLQQRFSGLIVQWILAFVLPNQLSQAGLMF